MASPLPVRSAVVRTGGRGGDSHPVDCGGGGSGGQGGRAADGGGAPDVAWLPLVVHEIFPGLLLLPEAVSDGWAGGFGWMAGGGTAISGSGTSTMGPAGGSDDGGPVDDPRRPASVAPPL